MAADRGYWDSNAFVGWLNAESGKVEQCEGVLEAAETGKIEIVTSAWTLTEVIKKKGEKPIPKVSEDRIRAFFENPWILIREVDRFVAERARDLIWAHGLTGPDAVHLASAFHLGLTVMDTYDDELIKLNGKLGRPPLRIGHPHVPHTPDLFPGTKHEASPRRKKRRR
jgi:predicted nucleic acid-binding protein